MSVRRLSGNALAGVVQVIGSALIMFELYRFLVRQLGPEQIGAWSLVLASASVTRLAEFGLAGGIVRFVASDLGSGDRVAAARTTWLAACSVALIIGLACGVAALLLPRIVSRVVVEQDMLPAALELIPWAVAGLWFASVAGVFTSCLDACQRSDLRASIVIGVALLQLGAAYIVVPALGIAGLGPIYLVQTIAMLIAAVTLARIALAQPFNNWLSVDSKRFKELFRYGMNLQMATLGQLLFDPVTKALMARFGGLSATGYYEMANRAITQFRAVIVAAYQALVPYLAARGGGGRLTPVEVRAAYLPALRAIVIFGTPYFTFLGAALPALLTAWLGAYSLPFLGVGFACLVGWYANVLTVPAYMLCLAFGEVRWVMLSHLAMGILNVAFSWIGGMMLGGLGVAIGSMLALGLGSFVVSAALHRKYEIRARQILDAPTVLVAAVCAAAFVVAAWSGLSGYSADRTVGLAIAVAACCLVAVLKHPYARELVTRVREGVRHA